MTRPIFGSPDWLRRLLSAALAVLLTLLGLSAPANPEPEPPTPSSSTVLVEGGQPLARIVFDDALDGSVEAAETLAGYIGKATGAHLPIVDAEAAPADFEGPEILLGAQSPAVQVIVDDSLDGQPPGAFVTIAAADGVTIGAHDPSGLRFGVYDFLERYLGILWLLPGEEGEHVPASADLVVPHQTRVDAPAVESRQFFGTETVAAQGEIIVPEENAVWADRNRINDVNNVKEGLQFHHNMTELFDTEVFADHPEYYVGGVLPTSYDFQPCLNATTAAAAATRIIAYFDQNPAVASYSLGLNDSMRFCEADPAHPLYPDATNSIGYLNMSNIYYPWVNDIVEAVLEEHPSKRFGLLAYWGVYDPPTNVQLNSSVIPYLTDDRLSWLDPTMSTQAKAYTDAWRAVADNIAFYEYLYGTPYNVPRVYFEQMAGTYAYADSVGVAAHVAELYPNWGEGPKAWLSAKLQWNPDADVHALLDQWYTAAVGEAAAESLADYYAIWEEFWTSDIFQSSWYQEWAGAEERYNYMPLFDPSYLAQVERSQVEQSRALIDQMLGHPGAPAQQARAGKLAEAFRFYEASALSYVDTSAPAIDVPADEAQALSLLTQLENSAERMAYAKERVRLAAEFTGDPILTLPMRPPIYGGAWDGLPVGLLSALTGWIDAGDPGSEFLAALADLQSSEEAGVRDFGKLLLAIATGRVSEISNGSFEAGSGAQANAWSYWVDSGGSMSRAAGLGNSGDYGMKLQGVFPVGGPIQELTVPPGRYGAVVRVNAGAVADELTSTQWSINLRGPDGVAARTITGAKKLSASAPSGWSSDLITFDVGDGEGNLQLSYLAWYFGSDESVAIDDLALYSLDGWSADSAAVVSADAESGLVTARFSSAPSEVLTAADLRITKTVDGRDAGVITIHDVEWDESTLTARITVAPELAESIAKSVSMAVSYKGAASVSADPYVVPAASGLTNLIVNGSFEEGDPVQPANAVGWGYWTEGGISWMSRTMAHVGTGEYSLVATDMNPVGGPIQTLPVVPGVYEATLRYFVPPGTAPIGRIQWYHNFWAASGAPLPSFASEITPIDGAPGEWTTYRIVFEVPSGAAQVQFGVPLYGFALNEQLFIDDVALYRLGDAPQ